MPARPTTTRRRRSTIRSRLDSAKAQLEKVGLKDTDGNGVVNFPADTAGVGGKDVEVTLLANADYQTDKNLAEGVVAIDGAARHPRDRQPRDRHAT